MQAKCPYCKVGCNKCKDGFIEVSMAEGLLYDLICRKCGQAVGFHIDYGDDPPDKDMSYICCMFCKDPQDLEWVLSGVSKNEE